MNALLDEASELLHGGDRVSDAIDRLVREFRATRLSHTDSEWRDEIVPAIRSHAVYPLLLEDPFVHHSACRPRGYPGDAELLDYIYRSDNIQPNLNRASALGRSLYAHSSNTSVTQAVRNRLQTSASEVDRLAAGGGKPNVMSLACGHLREAGKITGLSAGQLGQLIAVDQDETSLDLVRRECRGLEVVTQRLSAKQVIRGDARELGKMDFIYCLGLYDYLSDAVGARLMDALLELLTPGGKLWIANFVPGLEPSAYMEAVMDWWLLYRSPNQLESLLGGSDRHKIASHRLFFEPENNVAFLEIVRA